VLSNARAALREVLPFNAVSVRHSFLSDRVSEAGSI